MLWVFQVDEHDRLRLIYFGRNDRGPSSRLFEALSIVYDHYGRVRHTLRTSIAFELFRLDTMIVVGTFW